MATFVQITPDPFSKAPQQDSGANGGIKTAQGHIARDYDNVRRPVRGVVMKEETFCGLEVQTKDGKNILLVDSGGEEIGGFGYSPFISNFLIHNVQEQRSEKSQIVRTFGDTYIFFYGEEPRMYNISGTLFNTADFNWAAEFWENYDKYLRGTQCVTNATRVVMHFDEVIMYGYILSASATYVDDPQEYIQFQFQMIVSHYANISSIGSTIFPIVTETSIDPDSSAVHDVTFGDNGTDFSSDYKTTSTPKSDSLMDKLAKGGDFSSSGENYDRDRLLAGSYVSGSSVKTNVTENTNIFDIDVNKPQKFKYTTSFGGSTTTPVTYGTIRQNEDEYIARRKKNNLPTTSELEQHNEEADFQMMEKWKDPEFKDKMWEDPSDTEKKKDLPRDMVDAVQREDFDAVQLDRAKPKDGVVVDGNSDSIFDRARNDQLDMRIDRYAV